MSEETTRSRVNRGPLRRDRRSKVIAGVCGGLGRHLDIDPVVFRILFAVLSFVGGVGLVAYAAAWLFVPQQGRDRSEAHRLLTGSNPLLAVIVAIGLGLGALASISALTQGVTNVWPLWMIAAAVVGLLVWRGDIRLGGRPDSMRTPEQPPTWWQQSVATPEATTQSTTTGGGEPSSESGAETESETDTTGSTPASASASAFESGQPRDATPPEYTEPEFGLGPGRGPQSERPRPRPRRHGYGGLVLAILLAATGVLGILDAAGLVNLNWLDGGALVLLLLGAGMTLGGAFGKTTGLVPIGLVLAIPLITLSAVGVPLRGTVGDETWTPDSAAATQATYQLSIGDGDLNLANVVPGAGKTLKVSAQVGIGDLEVQVPTNVNVTIHAKTSIGLVQDERALENSNGSVGIGANKTIVIPAQGGKAQGTLVVDLNTGIGDVDVED